jgi:hypothetical protein
MSKNGPFGLSKGMSVEEIGTDLIDIGNSKYCSASVPRPHSSFEKYIF